MSEVISTELKSDLESIYGSARNLLDLIQDKTLENESEDTRKLFELIKFRLMDMEGTLQKDIYNCDYLITRFKIVEE